MDLEKAISSTLVFNCSDWRYIHLALLYLNMNRAIEHTSRERNSPRMQPPLTDYRFAQVAQRFNGNSGTSRSNTTPTNP